jgi:hypothetical protein
VLENGKLAVHGRCLNKAFFATPKVDIISFTLVCCYLWYTYCECKFSLVETANKLKCYIYPACKLVVLHIMENGAECAQTNNITASSLAYTIFTLTDFNSHVCFFSAMSTQLIVQMIWSAIKSPSHHLCKLSSSPNTSLFCPLMITSKEWQLSYIVRT